MPGDARGFGAYRGHSGDDVALRVQVHVRGGGSGSFLAVVEELRLAVGKLLRSGPDQHEAAAADIAGIGVNNGERKPHSDGRVDGVATLLQDLDAGVGSVGLDADDHGMRLAHRCDLAGALRGDAGSCKGKKRELPGEPSSSCADLQGR